MDENCGALPVATANFVLKNKCASFVLVLRTDFGQMRHFQTSNFSF
jgi:hypothetical protein